MFALAAMTIITRELVAVIKRQRQIQDVGEGNAPVSLSGQVKGLLLFKDLIFPVCQSLRYLRAAQVILRIIPASRPPVQVRHVLRIIMW